MRVVLAIVILAILAILAVPGTAPAEQTAKTPADDLAREIHTTFQPLLWSPRSNRLHIGAGGEVRITEGERGSPTQLPGAALDALRAAANRLHRRYGGRRPITVQAFGDNLEVTIGSSTRSGRKGRHSLSVYGTGGDSRHVAHSLAGAGGTVRSRSQNTVTGARERRLTAPDGRALIKLIGPDGAFGVIKLGRTGRSIGQVEVPAPGSSLPALRTRPDGVKMPMSAQTARAAYRWLGARPVPRTR